MFWPAKGCVDNGKETDGAIMTETIFQRQCPGCGEPVKSTWRICPACETRLQALTCPQCRAAVKENWKRCPECEALLICTKCGKRLAAGETTCATCRPDARITKDLGEAYTDPVCGIAFIRVAGGLFQMGDTLNQGSDAEQAVHDVILDEYYMARYPTTQRQWCVLMDENPSNFENPDNPVEQVTWFDAQTFAHKLSSAVHKDIEFSLPTEAQWEYAARSGGKNELFAGGNEIEPLAWFEANSSGRTHPVGQKKPNGLGLYDMSGNVWEWCLDTFSSDAYHRHQKQNPVISVPGADRVIRGGSWNLDAWSARCARRFSFSSDLFGPGLGFRLVMMQK